MTRSQFEMLTTRQRTCCKVCFIDGDHAVLVAGTMLRKPGERLVPGSTLYFQRAYRSLERHIKKYHLDSPLVRRIMKW